MNIEEWKVVKGQGEAFRSLIHNRPEYIIMQLAIKHLGEIIDKIMVNSMDTFEDEADLMTDLYKKIVDKGHNRARFDAMPEGVGKIDS